ncbi:MAG: phosphocholine cytidylyltransferase family protein [Parachlamydia sp.]|jgi:choline kinase|nr:phosphocholine cytidylyltransferase family protein [Parachlamydia sp.]
MKAVILAAGKGTRLDSSEGHDPKPLTCLSNGLSILKMQLQNLSRLLPVDDILVVVGYHKEQIMDAHPELLYVYNPSFAQENTAKSLLRAFKKINDDVLWINGDVVFNPAIFSHFDFKCSFMVVNQAEVGEEEVKYKSTTAGMISEVSKQVENGTGEALGINFCTRADLKLLSSCLEVCEKNDYFEKGIEKAIHQAMQVKAIQVEKEDCAEIDFPEDLVRANQLIKKWNG